MAANESHSMNKSFTIISEIINEFNSLQALINDLTTKPNIPKAANKVISSIQSTSNDIADKLNALDEEFSSQDAAISQLRSQQRGYDNIANLIVKTIDQSINNALPKAIELAIDLSDEFKSIEHEDKVIQHASNDHNHQDNHVNSQYGFRRSNSRTFYSSDNHQRNYIHDKPKQSKFDSNKRLPKPNHAVLVVSEAVSNQSNDAPPSVTELLNENIEPHSFNIISTVKFPSGSMLIKLNSEDDAKRFSEAVAAIEGIKIKEKTNESTQFRIHQVPIKITAEQLAADIQSQLNDSPSSIEFVEYKYENPVGKLAIIKCSTSLYHSARQVKSIRIGYDHFDLDTRLLIPRCSRCRLLGHTIKYCQNDEFTQRSEDSNSKCRDCHSFNSTISRFNLQSSRKRPTRHSTGDRNCPTFKFYLNKAARKHSFNSTQQNSKE